MIMMLSSRLTQRSVPHRRLLFASLALALRLAAARSRSRPRSDAQPRLEGRQPGGAGEREAYTGAAREP